MPGLAALEYDPPSAQPRPTGTPRAAVCLLSPSRIIGEAFGRALATGGWAVDVIDASILDGEQRGSSSADGGEWWEGRTVVIVFENRKLSVPPALRRGEAGQPSLVVLQDGSTPLDHLPDSRPVQRTIESLLTALGESSGANRLGSNLTARHRDILQLVAIGYTTEEVGDRLGIAAKTVNNHLSTMYRRMHARNLTQAVLMAVRAGLVDFTP